MVFVVVGTYAFRRSENSIEMLKQHPISLIHIKSGSYAKHPAELRDIQSKPIHIYCLQIDSLALLVAYQLLSSMSYI